MGWVREGLHDCVYDAWQITSVVLGLLNVLCWLTAQAPQFYKNYKRGGCEALSLWFLAEWLLGDTFNLLGCLLTGSQLPTQTGTAYYFVASDCLMLAQYAYYSAKGLAGDAGDECPSDADSAEGVAAPLLGDGEEAGEEQERSQTRRGSGRAAAPLLAALGTVALVGAGGYGAGGEREVGPRGPARRLLGGAVVHAASGLAGAGAGEDPRPVCGATYNPRWMVDAGQAMGWLSAVFYLGSRASQIAHNLKNGTAEGLSLGMFGLAITANVLYAGSVMLRTDNFTQLAEAAPWLVGSLGTVALDATIFSQARWLGSGPADEEVPGAGGRRRAASAVLHGGAAAADLQAFAALREAPASAEDS